MSCMCVSQDGSVYKYDLLLYYIFRYDCMCHFFFFFFQAEDGIRDSDM